MTAREKKQQRWVVPPWMEPYRNLIADTGGNPIEELMNDHKTTVFENAPRAILCVAVKDQVDLLTRLYKRALLATEDNSLMGATKGLLALFNDEAEFEEQYVDQASAAIEKAEAAISASRSAT